MSWKNRLRVVVLVPFVGVCVFPTVLTVLSTAGAQQTRKPSPMTQQAPMGQASAVSDPLALVKVVSRVTEKRERFEAIMKEVRKTIADRPKLDLKGEIKVLKAYQDDLIPFLRAQRDDVIKNRGPIDEAYLGYMDSLRQAINTLQQDAVAIEKQLKSDKIKSVEIRDHLIKLAGTSRTTSTKFGDRLKQAGADLVTIQTVLHMVEESGIVLDYWEGQVRAMVEAGERGEAALKSVEGLREFARRFQESFEQFLAIPDRLQTVPQIPAVEQDKKS